MAQLIMHVLAFFYSTNNSGSHNVVKKLLRGTIDNYHTIMTMTTTMRPRPWQLPYDHDHDKYHTITTMTTTIRPRHYICFGTNGGVEVWSYGSCHGRGRMVVVMVVIVWYLSSTTIRLRPWQLPYDHDNYHMITTMTTTIRSPPWQLPYDHDHDNYHATTTMTTTIRSRPWQIPYTGSDIDNWRDNYIYPNTIYALVLMGGLRCGRMVVVMVVVVW
jgi:hypothetical protein